MRQFRRLLKNTREEFSSNDRPDLGLYPSMIFLPGVEGTKGEVSFCIPFSSRNESGPHEEEDNRLARLAIRYILCNPRITAPIPGLINAQQVDNVALAVKERRELDAQEKAELDRAMDRAWARLPYHYRWLKNFEHV